MSVFRGLEDTNPELRSSIEGDSQLVNSNLSNVNRPQDGSHSSSHDGHDDHNKANRLRKACDSCSIRKVKCDESGPPCRACVALEIPCTFDRPSRRRGPPNRHAEAIKKRRLGSPGTGPYISEQSSPTEVAQTLASLSSYRPKLSAESICPLAVLSLLIDDFFIYIHPLVPIPHEPSFRKSFAQREDIRNPRFLALLAAMISALVSSFPRKPRLHLKAQGKESLFPSSISLVERCHRVAVEARGPGYLDQELNVLDAAISYFLGLSSAYTFNMRQCRLYFGECLNIIRCLGLHKVRRDGRFDFDARMTVEGSPNIGTKPEINFITRELGRRLFWVMFVGVRTLEQLGAPYTELNMIIVPYPSADPYPPLPLEVDDIYIHPTHISHQPPGIISRLAGFNYNVKVYSSYTTLIKMELAYGVDEVFDWERQRRVLEECLHTVRNVLATVPPELQLRPGNGPGEFASSDLSYQSAAAAVANFHPPMTVPEKGYAIEEIEKRYIQYEIQKANINASQLGTRSYLVEKYWNLFDAYQRRIESIERSPQRLLSPSTESFRAGHASPAQRDMLEREMATERENIVLDLLRVLSSINQVNMEPNGGSFINKIRQIASTLIDVPRTRKGSIALRAENYLHQFLEILMKLEKVSPPPNAEGRDLEGDEEVALSHWADLREHQTRFAQAGGFLAET